MNDLEKIKEMIKNIGSGKYKDGSSTKKGFLYHSIPFEDFLDIPVHKKSSNDELDVILKDCVDFNNKKVLDIGCANGLFSFNLASLGANVVAYEADKNVFDVNVEIAKFKNIKNVIFYNESFDLNTANNIDCDFDIIIMLNIHMWIYKQIGKEKTFDLMKSLSSKTKIMYFQTAHAQSGGGFKINEFKTENDIANYLASCGFKDVNRINHNKKWFNRFMFRALGNV